MPRTATESSLHVEASAERGPDLDVVDAERDALVGGSHIGGTNLGTFVIDAERDRGEIEIPEPTARGVIDVHHGALAPLPCEQSSLRREVRVHRCVVIQMILREVREDGAREPDPSDAVLIEAVGRDLHRDRSHTFVPHLGEESLQVGRLGRGPQGRCRTSTDPNARRPNDAGDQVRRSEHRLEHVRGRRLAVRAGHSDHRHPLGRPVVERRRNGAHRLAHRGDEHLRGLDRKPPFDRERYRSLGDGLRREIVPIEGRPGNAEEQGSQGSVLRAVAQVADRHAGITSDLATREIDHKVRKGPWDEEGGHGD